MRKKRIVFIILLLLFVLVACNGNNNNNNDNGNGNNGNGNDIQDNGNNNGNGTDPEKPVTVKEVRFKDNVDTFYFTLESFRLSDIVLEVIYTDDNIEPVLVKRSMIKDEFFNLLLTTGIYFIEIDYLDKTLECLVEMTSDNPQINLPDLVIYSLKREDDDNVIYDFYSDRGTLFSFSFIINHSLNPLDIHYQEEIEGINTVKIEDDKITVIYSFGKNISSKKLLFSIKVPKGEKLDESMLFDIDNSKALTFNRGELKEVLSIRYYLR